ncbi:SOS response-associated peptidase [Duganella sp. BuS-21]|uniref:SOS response-associated peptidase n=1 Tax=Duganella sp. BuS-21 TaxID=2943848 RepID=UPI0035A6AC77
MCVNFRPPDPELLDAVMGVIIDLNDSGFWKAETWKDYAAPIVRRGADGRREGIVASYGIVPRKRIPAGVRPFDTMNARSETVGQLRSFSGAWKRTQLCLVPMTAFYEPCYETGKAVRWGIGMADQSMFAVAGLWREWEGDAGLEHSFTQLTINADDHSLMNRFHKPDDEKRALVIVPQAEWDDWLACTDPEYARSFLSHYPADLMTSCAAPVPLREKKAVKSEPEAPESGQLGLL